MIKCINVNKTWEFFDGRINNLEVVGSCVLYAGRM